MGRVAEGVLEFILGLFVDVVDFCVSAPALAQIFGTIAVIIALVFGLAFFSKR
jgi:hypothetical protein